MMKKIVLVVAMILLFVSCSTRVEVKALSESDVAVSLTNSFSENAAKMLRVLLGIDASQPVFSAQDLKDVMTGLSVEDVECKIPSPNEVAASGKIRNFSASDFSIAGIVAVSKNSVMFVMGPAQFLMLYEILSEETKSYFDMMMIPALIGETMSIDEYRSLLASMYGPTFADEIVDGKLNVVLSSPDGKVTKKISVTLGEILTMKEQKVWEISY